MIILVRNIRYDHIYIASLRNYFLSQWSYIVILMWQCALIAYWTLIPYGVLTTLLSPCRLHAITLSLYMMYFSRSTKKMSSNLYETSTEHAQELSDDNDLDHNDDHSTRDNGNKRQKNANLFFQSDESDTNLRIDEL